MEVRVLGTIGLANDGQSIPVTAAKVRRLLAVLVVRVGETCASDLLIEALWPSPPASSRKLLQLYVSQLRRLLPAPGRVVTDGGGYRLELPEDALDAARFEALLVEGRAAFADGNPTLARSLFERALRLWRGSAYGELAYEAFARAEADRLEELRLVAGEERIDAELTLGRHATILPEVRSLAAANPLRERTQAQAMLALYRCGRQSDALEVFAAVRRALRDELGLEPGPELHQLQRRILRHDHGLAVPAGAAPALGPPAPPTRLLGREREVGEIGELLVQGGVRLLVLVGAGGSGKTRLAIEVARRIAGAFANGAQFVELAPLSDPAHVVPAIARAVGFERVEADPLEQLARELRSRELLLVLDNAEHVRDAAPELVQLLAQAPRVTLLVTSRAVLHVSGERVYPVDPLPSEAAVALYMERAGAYSGDDETRRTVDAICGRLDRLPLAIELAAAHARALTPAELLARLERRLPLLAGAPRDLPARQATLEATIEWSTGLLGEVERGDLARLAVFAGGWTLDAAESVCGVGLDRTMRLLDHSLLKRTTDAGVSRYGMLETVREHALASWNVTAEEAHDVRTRHADYFASVAESAGLYVEAEGPMRHDLVRRERENLLAALTWTLEHRAIELGLRIAVALENYWVTSAPFEGDNWLQGFLAHADDADPTLHARALRALGSAILFTGETDEGLRLYQASLREYESLGDEVGIGILEHRVGFELLRAGDRAAARRLVSRSIRRHEKVGFVKGAALGTGILGHVERAAGRPDVALELFDRSLRRANETGYAWWSCQMLFAMADLLLERGDTDSARARLVESIPLLQHISDRINSIEALALLAKIEAAANRPERAGLLWGAAQAEEARAPTGLWESVRTSYEAVLARSASDTFKRGEAAGRELTLPAALGEAGHGALAKLSQ